MGNAEYMGVSQNLLSVQIQLKVMTSASGEVLSSLRGKIIELPETKEKEEWTPFNGEMHMQGIKVIVNNPTPKKTKTKVDTFEDTLFLMDLYKHKMQLAKYEEKEKMIQDMAMEQKRKKELSKGKVVNYIR